MKHSEYKASYEKEIRLLTEDTANTAQKFARKQKQTKTNSATIHITCTHLNQQICTTHFPLFLLEV